MGIVYEAEQVSLGRRVALKVLPFAATLDGKQLQRFHNEAKAAACLHHEHIIPVYSVGCERSVHFYAMQFIDGRTLAQLIQALRPNNGPAEADANATQDYRPAGGAPTAPVAALSTERSGSRGRAFYRQAAELIAQAAEALEHAHSLGIVHRDIKPANLLVGPGGKLWVGDFGLARLGADAGLTMSGDLLGTLRYMSPEQALARHGLVDHRADVYALGATLYELLTLRPAVTGAERAEVLRQVAFEEPAAPRQLDKTIPAEPETIVVKALEKNPADRYATAQELADDLRCFLEDKPIRARRPTLVQRAAKWSRRQGPWLAAAAGILLLAVLGLAASAAVIWSQKSQVTQALTREETAAQNARRKAEEADDQRKKADDQRKEAERQRTEAFANLRTALGMADGNRKYGDLLRMQGDLVGAEKAYLQLAQVMDKLVAHLPPAQPGSREFRENLQHLLNHANYLNYLGTFLEASGKFPQAEQHYCRSLGFFQAHVAQEGEYQGIHVGTLGAARAWKDLARVLHASGKVAEAEKAYRQVVALHTEIAAAIPTLAWYLMSCKVECSWR
jgi:tetratricopeptide (TPR) repeat protein